MNDFSEVTRKSIKELETVSDLVDMIESVGYNHGRRDSTTVKEDKILKWCKEELFNRIYRN